MKVIIKRQVFREGFGIWVYEERGNRIFLGKPALIEFEDMGENNCAFRLPDDPTFHISDMQFASLRNSIRDELIGAGYESSAIANASELKATKFHLDDMRKLVFNK